MAISATIDRFEGDLAVLIEDSEQRTKVDVERSLLPEGARTGDVISLSQSLGEADDESVRRALSGARIDRRAAEERSQRSRGRIERLKRRGQ